VWPPGGVRGPQQAHAVRRDLSRIVYCVFNDVVIPLIRNHFYVTETEPGKNRLFFYRKAVWRDVVDLAVGGIVGDGRMYRQIESADDLAKTAKTAKTAKAAKTTVARSGQATATTALPPHTLAKRSYATVALATAAGTAAPASATAAAAAAAAAAVSSVAAASAAATDAVTAARIAASAARMVRSSGGAPATPSPKGPGAAAAAGAAAGCGGTAAAAAAAASSAATARRLPSSHVRLLPKAKGVRPIVNLSGRPSPSAPSVNTLLQAAFHVLSHEARTQGTDVLGSSVLGLNDVYARLMPFLLRWQELGRPQLYFVSLDIARSFDTIRHDALLRALEGIFTRRG
jgi:hypothetical protein